MAIPEQFKNFKSYSRYRGFGDKYDLSDEYFATIINGNLLCTDTECDIDCDGNICLITPEGDCFHIGTIPQTEDGSKPVFSFDGNHTLVVKYKVYYDNDHHHGGYETIKCPLVITSDMILKLKFRKIIWFLDKECHNAYQGGRYRNTCDFWWDTTKLKVKLTGTRKLINRYSSPATDYFTQYIVYTENGWTLQPDENGKMQVQEEVFRDSSKLYKCIESLNFFKYRFYIKEYKNGKYSVVDKVDNVEEWYDSTQIKDFYKQGVQICGVFVLNEKFCIQPIVKDLAMIGRL